MTVELSTLKESPFLASLARGALVSDGAMGTTLHERGVPADACLELVNIERPEIVVQLHRDFIAAGSDFIQTNTFGANRLRLAAYGAETRVEELNRAAVRLAREAMAQEGRSVFVAGDIGPLGSEVSDGEAAAAFEEQLRVLADEKVDAFLFETFTGLREIELAVAAARRVAPAMPVIAEVSFLGNDKTVDGFTARDAAERLSAAGADVVGANCGEGPPQVLRLIKEMAAVRGLLIAAQPSAGKPQLVQRRVVYSASAEYMADYARRFIEAGAVVVGGCCGTSPRHVAAIQQAVHSPTRHGVITAPAEKTEATPPAASSSLRAKLAAGHFVVSVEIDPPRGLSPRRALEAAAAMVEAGADVINVGDSPMAEVRLSAIAMAALLKERAGVEPIVHCSTRDRNLMALQSDLMGAHAMGLRNVLCIKGDPHALGSYTNAAAVWDVNALGLMRILKGFNAGHDAIDKPVSPRANFFVGAAVNPCADDLRAEARMVRRKAEAGADFLISQAVFSHEPVERLLEQLGPDHPPIILGIWPVQSLRQSNFLSQHVTAVPEDVHKAIEAAGDGAEQRGLELAHALLEKVQPLVQGVYFIPSFGRYGGVTELVVAGRKLAGRRGA